MRNTTVPASVSQQHLIHTLPVSTLDNWSSSDTWSGQKTQPPLSTNYYMAMPDEGDLAPTTATTSASWQDVIRMKCWSWLRTEMSGENLWSSGLTCSHPTRERERSVLQNKWYYHRLPVTYIIQLISQHVTHVNWTGKMLRIIVDRGSL